MVVTCIGLKDEMIVKQNFVIFSYFFQKIVFFLIYKNKNKIMKHIKLFENFLTNIENLVKGKSEKGKLIAEMLKKDNISTEGFAYTFRYLGGVDLTPEDKSHPLSYLCNYKPNKGKAKFENENLVISDDLKNKKVVNILPMLDKAEKEGIKEHGRIQSSAVIKFNYKFDLSKDIPTFEVKDASLFNIETGKFELSDRIDDMNTVTELDGEINEEYWEENGTIFNKDLVTTYQNFIDELNKRTDLKEIIKDRFQDQDVVTEGKLIKSFKKFK